MKKHKNKIILLLVLLSISVACLWQQRVFTLKTAMKIAYIDRKTVPIFVWAGPNDQLSALSCIGRAYHITAYTANGKTAWQDKVRAASSDTGILIIASGRTFGYTAVNHELTQQPNIVLLSVDGQRVTSKRISINAAFPTWVANALAQDENLYVVGEAEVPATASYPTIVKIARQGKIAWAKTEQVDAGLYDKIVIDKEGNLIAAGTIGSAMGTCMAKYAPCGQRLWLKNSIVNDSAYTAWIGIRQTGNIAAIVGLYSMNYVLVTLNSSGKLISEQQLTGGSGLCVADAALNNKDELFILYNVHYHERALLTKYDARGKIVWAGDIDLPNKCETYQIILDNISTYIFGYWPPYDTGVSDGPYVNAFIYKILN